MLDDKKYDKPKLIAKSATNWFWGTFLGSLTGSFGSLILPISLRSEYNDLDNTINDIRFGKDNKKETWCVSWKDQVQSAMFHVPRLTTKIGLQATIVYSTIEDVYQGGIDHMIDSYSRGGITSLLTEEGMKYSILLIPNALSLAYETGRKMTLLRNKKNLEGEIKDKF